MITLGRQLTILGIGLLTIVQTRASTIIWTNDLGGNWGVAENWQPPQVPGAGDHAVITNEGTYSVALDISPTLAGFTLGGSSGTQSLLIINGPTLTLNGTATANSNAVVELSGGSVAGPGALVVYGLLDWTGGEMSGSGATVIAAGAMLEIAGSEQKTLNRRAVTNLGTVVWSGTGTLLTREGAPFNNEVGGIVDVRSDGLYARDIFSLEGSFHNAGSFRKTAGTGTTTFGQLPFYNTGTLSVWRGTLDFTMAPILNPGGTVEVGLTGPTEYGQISSGQAISLFGHLAVSFLDGFVPDSGQQYDVVVAPIVGTFERFTAPAISPLDFINLVHEPHRVRLEVTDPTPTIAGMPSVDTEGRLAFNIQGIVNQFYAVEVSTNLVEWTGLRTNGIPISTVWPFVDEDSAPYPWRFYRVLFVP